MNGGVVTARIQHAALCTLGLVLATAAAPDRAQARGSHFLLELDGGAALTGDGGAALSADFGIGGKPPGWTPRLYFIAHGGLSLYGVEDEGVDGVALHEEGDFRDIAAGLRVYVPIARELRWLGEALLGASYATGRYTEPGLGPLEAEEWLLLGLLSTGLQQRVLQELSIGARVTLALNETGLVGVHRVAGASDAARLTITAGLTWHF